MTSIDASNTDSVSSVLSSNVVPLRRPTKGRSLLADLFCWVADKMRLHHDKREVRLLMRMDDNMLRDIGLTRGDVEWVVRQPASSRASEKLDLIRRKNWYV